MLTSEEPGSKTPELGFSEVSTSTPGDQVGHNQQPSRCCRASVWENEDAASFFLRIGSWVCLWGSCFWWSWFLLPACPSQSGKQIMISPSTWSFLVFHGNFEVHLPKKHPWKPKGIMKCIKKTQKDHAMRALISIQERQTLLTLKPFLWDHVQCTQNPKDHAMRTLNSVQECQTQSTQACFVESHEVETKPKRIMQCKP